MRWFDFHLNIQALYSQSVCLNEVSSRLHLIAHQNRKNIIGANRVFDLNLKYGADAQDVFYLFHIDTSKMEGPARVDSQ